jgi:hypothetical protein
MINAASNNDLKIVKFLYENRKNDIDIECAIEVAEELECTYSKK